MIEGPPEGLFPQASRDELGEPGRVRLGLEEEHSRPWCDADAVTTGERVGVRAGDNVGGAACRDGDRQRDLLPLPADWILREFGQINRDASRGVLRRGLRKRHTAEWARDMAVSLNELCNTSASSAPFEPSAAQRESMTLMFRAAQSYGDPPEKMDGAGALDELRKGRGYQQEPVTAVPLEPDLLALPAPGFQPIALESTAGPVGRKIVECLYSKQLPVEEAEKNVRESGLRRPYNDPCFRLDHRKYIRVLRRLDEAGLLCFRRRRRQAVGLFAVAKKNGEQRLIVDARQANLAFADPESVKLATGGAFSSLRVDEGPAVCIGSTDIKVAFYAMRLPAGLEECFGLNPIRAGEMDITMLDDQPLDSRTWIYPCLQVLPMGWTHALWACQTLHEGILSQDKMFSDETCLRDGRPSPGLTPFVHTAYVDNFVSLSQDIKEAEKTAVRAGELLVNAGLPIHNPEVSRGGDTLGWHFDEHRPEISASPRVVWKLRLGILEILKKGRSTSREIRSVVGNFTVRALVRRELLSVCGACFLFAETHEKDPGRVPLWPSVHRELRHMAALIGLARRDLAAGYCQRLHVFDASSWGLGVMAKDLSEVDAVKKMSMYNDRWRFAREDERRRGARGRDMDTEVSEAGEGVVEPVPEAIWGGSWTRITSRRWKPGRKESQVILEGKAAVWTMKHLTRSLSNFGRRHVMIGDALSIVLALTKGRSSVARMLKLTRIWAAFALASGIQATVRWVPSERNAADSASRGGRSLEAHEWTERNSSGGNATRRAAGEEAKAGNGGSSPSPGGGPGVRVEDATRGPSSTTPSPAGARQDERGKSRGSTQKVRFDQASTGSEAHLSGEELRAECLRDGLRETLPGVRGLGRGVPFPVVFDEGDRCSDGGLDGRKLFRRKAASRGGKASRRSDLGEGAREEVQGAASQPPGHCRMEEPGTSRIAAPLGVVRCVHDDRGDDEVGIRGSRVGDGNVVRAVPTAIGVSAAQRQRPRAADQSRAASTPEVERGAPPGGAGRVEQNRGVRRVVAHRQPGIRLAPRNLDPAEETSPTSRSHIRHQLQHMVGNLSEDQSKAGVGKDDSSDLIWPTPRRSYPRGISWVPRHVRDQTERPLEVRQHLEAVLPPRARESNGALHEARHAGRSSSSRSTNWIDPRRFQPTLAPGGWV